MPRTTIVALSLALASFVAAIAAQSLTLNDSSTAVYYNGTNSSSSSSSSYYNLTSSSSSSYSSSSSSTGSGDLFKGASAGLVVWGIFCFIVVILFTSFLLKYYARPGTPIFAAFLTWLAWIVTFSICFLVPIDLLPNVESFLTNIWSTLYWASFLLMWFIIPFASGYYDNGGFTVKQRIIASLKFNAILALVAIIIGGAGFIYLLAAAAWTSDEITGMLVCASTVWGLIMLVVSAGYGLIEIPRTLYYYSNLERRRDFIHFTAGSIHHESQEARDVLIATMHLLKQLESPLQSKAHGGGDGGDDEDVIVNEQASLNDSPSSLHAQHVLHYHYFRTIQSVVKDHELELAHSFKTRQPIEKLSFSQELLASAHSPDGLSLKQLVMLHNHTRNASKKLTLCETQWRDTVNQALTLNSDLTNQSSSKHFRWFVGKTKLKIVQGFFIFSVVLSVLILFCEITVPTSSSISPLGLLVEVTRSFFLSEQIFTAIPLVYLSVCAYWPLFQLRLFSMYYVGKHRTDESTLLLNATLMLRISVPLAFNFILLLHVDAGSLTSFIGTITVIPFFGDDFTRWFPVIMAIISVLVFSRIFHYMLGRCIGIDSMKFDLVRKIDDDADVKFNIDEGKVLIENELKKRAKLAGGLGNGGSSEKSERTIVDGLKTRIQNKLNATHTADDEARERIVELGRRSDRGHERQRRSMEFQAAIGADNSYNGNEEYEDEYGGIDGDTINIDVDNDANNDADSEERVYDAEGYDQFGYDVNGYDRYGGYLDDNGDYVDPNEALNNAGHSDYYHGEGDDDDHHSSFR